MKKKVKTLFCYCSYCGETSRAGVSVKADVCPKCQHQGCMGDYKTQAEMSVWKAQFLVT